MVQTEDIPIINKLSQYFVAVISIGLLLIKRLSRVVSHHKNELSSFYEFLLNDLPTIHKLHRVCIELRKIRADVRDKKESRRKLRLMARVMGDTEYGQRTRYGLERQPEACREQATHHRILGSLICPYPPERGLFPFC